ncbi:DUF6894 family protein [Sphingomonas sp. MMS24-J13]|uniref:DUF6894 family protein n=1 Tax=Sphingomonas sp. MMS24-J13 TaxID=3238686 RepID=UPI00384B7D46
MPRFHFNINDSFDHEGTVLASVQAAKCEAVKLAGRVICEEHADSFWLSREWTMSVTDDQNLLLFQLVMLGTEAPALRGAA